jgi:hypothetical protein
MLRLLGGIGRQRAILRGCHVAAQGGHHGADRLREQPRRRQRGRAEREARVADEFATGCQSKKPESMYRSHSVPTTLMLS